MAFVSAPPHEDTDHPCLIFHCHRLTIAVHHCIDYTTVAPPALNCPSSSFVPFFPKMPHKSSKKAPLLLELPVELLVCFLLPARDPLPIALLVCILLTVLDHLDRQPILSLPQVAVSHCSLCDLVPFIAIYSMPRFSYHGTCCMTCLHVPTVPHSISVALVLLFVLGILSLQRHTVMT
jgi:hypothetical protein